MKLLSFVIPYFNQKFNYLNNENKRKGVLLFSNHALTNELEALAIKLVKDVTHLADINNNWNMVDTDRGDNFINLVNAAYQEANVIRKGHSSKETYKSAKFEKELARGLVGVIKNIPCILNTFNIGIQLDISMSSDDPRLKGFESVKIILHFKERCEALHNAITNGVDYGKMGSDDITDHLHIRPS